jgi:SAM-dependent methyltransferase
MGSLDRGNFEANIEFLNRSGLLRPKKSLFEIGSGSGHLVAALQSQGFDIQGSDISSDAIVQAKEEFGVRLHRCDGYALPLKDGSIDIIMSFDVFEHIEDSDRHLQEVRRVLRQGGYYLFQTPNKWISMPTSIIKNRSWTAHRRYHVALHSYGQLRKRLKKNGFSQKFVDIRLVTPFYRQKLRKIYGPVLSTIFLAIGPDDMPMPLRSNFYVIARRLR